jgi:hypothetical protein
MMLPSPTVIDGGGSGEVRRIDPRDVDRIRLVLQRLNLALEIEDLNLHSYRLHRLTGDRAGFWSIQSAPTGASSSASRTAEPTRSS